MYVSLDMCFSLAEMTFPLLVFGQWPSLPNGPSFNTGSKNVYTIRGRSPYSLQLELSYQVHQYTNNYLGYNNNFPLSHTKYVMYTY